MHISISLRRSEWPRSLASLAAARFPSVPATVPVAGPDHVDGADTSGARCGPTLPTESVSRRSPARSQSPPYCGWGSARALVRAAYGPAVSACR